jgi:hypothetical protein
VVINSDYPHPLPATLPPEKRNFAGTIPGLFLPRKRFLTIGRSGHLQRIIAVNTFPLVMAKKKL